MRRLILVACCAIFPTLAWGGAQKYEELSIALRNGFNQAVSDYPSPHTSFKSPEEERAWLDAMSPKLAERLPDQRQREEFLVTVHYEATRAGLSPQMVLGLIEVESNFKKYAVSNAGARGYMQVMPFWTQLANRAQDNLFHVRINLRYGCWILKHYLDMENGDLFRVLGRYNGSLGETDYPNRVLRACIRHWKYPPAGKGCS